MFWGFLFIAIGIGWILQYMGYLPKDMDFFWPIVFIALGVSIILKKGGTGCCDWWGKKEEKKGK